MIIQWGGHKAGYVTTWHLRGGSVVIDPSYLVHVATALDAAFCITFADPVQMEMTFAMVQLELTISMAQLEITFGGVVCQNT